MSGDSEVKTLIISHPNTDFDAFASMLAAQLLYQGSHICLQGGVNRNVREFFNLHADEIPHVELSDVDPEALRRVVLIEVGISERLGEALPLVERDDVEVVLFDHHPGGRERLSANSVVGTDGSLVTTMLKILLERGVEPSIMHATAFALGIHEDTGSLTFPSATRQDASSIAYCMKAGANQTMLARYLRKPLSENQRELLFSLADGRQVLELGGVMVIAASAKADTYVEDISGLASRVGEVEDWDALFIAVGMEDRTFVVGRSRSDGLHANQVVKAVGGGGHPQAASAIVREKDPAKVLDRMIEVAREVAKPTEQARDIMSKPVHTIQIDMAISEALVELQHRGQSGIQVEEGDVIVGTVMREDLDRAVRHKLGHAPVQAVMSAGVPVLSDDTTMPALRSVLASGKAERVVVTTGGEHEKEEKGGVVDRLPSSKAAGVVTRGDILRAMHEIGISNGPSPNEDASRRFRAKLDDIPRLSEILPSVQRAAATEKGVYLVGGAVRDLLIGKTSFDLDLVVEGDAIEFANRLAGELDAHSHPHEKFQTAVIKGRASDGGELRVDVASARTEFYESPGALPEVAKSTLEQDLARRDFTVNSMAASLRADDLGAVYDSFNGYRDLNAGTLRVLHNLSFVEDPTRILRALLYEARLGFKMEPRTLSLARGCVEMQLMGGLVSERLLDELLEVIALDDIEYVIKRMHELGLDRSLHPGMSCDSHTVALVKRADELLSEASWGGEANGELLRFALMLRDIPTEEIFKWLDRLKLRRQDQEVVASVATVPPKLNPLISKEGLSPSEVYLLLHEHPMETLVACAAMSPPGSQAERYIDEWLANWRHVRLEIGGDDLIAEGLPQSPALGMSLERALHLKLDGKVEGREQELKAAERIAREELSGSN